MNSLKPTHARTTSTRVGRGGKRGKTSGRGTKGQNARAGNSNRPEIRDRIKKIPKLRGHGKNRSRTVRPTTSNTAVNLAALERTFNAGDTVSPTTLYRKGLASTRGGYVQPVKILGTGELTKKLTIVGCSASTTAIAAIEKQGGTITK